MTVTVRTLTVNAAFLQEIKEDNSQLRELLQDTRELFSCRCSPSARKAAEMLSQLRDQLAMHFALEDAYGYFEDALALAPRLSQQAEALHGQHQTLFLDICDLADLAEKLVYTRQAANEPGRLARAFGDFYDQFQAHEDAENELINSAFDDDIGVGD